MIVLNNKCLLWKKIHCFPLIETFNFYLFDILIHVYINQIIMFIYVLNQHNLCTSYEIIDTINIHETFF